MSRDLDISHRPAQCDRIRRVKIFHLSADSRLPRRRWVLVPMAPVARCIPGHRNRRSRAAACGVTCKVRQGAGESGRRMDEEVGEAEEEEEAAVLPWGRRSSRSRTTAR